MISYCLVLITVNEKYLESLYEDEMLPKITETIRKIMSYGVSRKYISVNWANNRSVIGVLSNESMYSV